MIYIIKFKLKFNPFMLYYRTLTHIMREMVQTERDYVLSLQYVIENYIPELQRPDVPQALRGKGSIIFGNIEKIYQFHRQYFLREVERCERNPFQISHYFLMHVSLSFICHLMGSVIITGTENLFSNVLLHLR